MLGQIDATERAKQFLEYSVKDYKIFVDTCSLLFEEADTFWANIVPILQREKKSVIIPYRVYEEVDKFASDPNLCEHKNPADHNLYSRAVNAKKGILALQMEGLAEIFGDKTDNFADNVFLTVFTQYRMKYNLMLVTQDRNLASDIINIGKSRAVNTNKRILVKRINNYGFLSMFNDRTPRDQQDFSPREEQSQWPKFVLPSDIVDSLEPQNNQQDVKPSSNVDGITLYKNSVGVPDEERFSLVTSLTNVAGTISVSHIPSEGDTVTAELRGGKREKVELVETVASGGEGIIYATNNSTVVAKIYKRDKLDKSKFEKIKLMLTKNIECDGVCLPIACLYNLKDEFIGYLMKKAHGKELQKCVFMPLLLKKTFPHWKKNDTVELCITILKKIKYLHDRNIILGDINPNNILVVSPREVYFVDTDSYQIEGYPCPVGTINFTAPEIQRKRYSEFLRTLGNERFAVATLLFMIMLPGKPPYSLQGGENQIDNIMNMDFAYASGERTTGKAPEGMWRFCWSHLPRYLKDDFYEVFRKDGERSTEDTRYSTGDWLQKFEHYMDLLASGKYAEQDEMSLELFPTRLKKNPNATYVRCKLCNNEVEEEKTAQGYCFDCLKKKNKVTYVRCKLCNNEFKEEETEQGYCNDCFNNSFCYINGDNINSIKNKLLKKRFSLVDYDRLKKSLDNTRYVRIRCANCNSIFELTYRQFFEKKGPIIQVPKICPNCSKGKPYSNLKP